MDAQADYAVRALAREEFFYPLAHLGGARPLSPTWYASAMALHRTDRRLSVEGAEIEYLSWGDPQSPPLLLLHGMNAHAEWWGPVAPLLAQDYHVVSLSFSGNGNSGWRPEYDMRQFAREVLAVAEATSLFSHRAAPILVAHSFGGRIASLLTASEGSRLGGAVIVDSLLSRYNFPLDIEAARPRLYRSEVEALARFRFLPSQGSDHIYLVDDIARASMRADEGGWRWKSDPAMRSRIAIADPWASIAEARCSLAFIRGEHSEAVTRDQQQEHRVQAPAGSLFIEIADSAHHVMVDQPLALLAALRSIVGIWLQD